MGWRGCCSRRSSYWRTAIWWRSRGTHAYGGGPLLFQVLNEMDGLTEEADVAFLLTTNRADLLEPALSQRPGRVDLAVEIPLPDAAGRARLLSLYGPAL